VIAAQVLKLVESGAVDLDRPIDDYLGGTDLQTNGATVRQVLGMRSGIGEVDADPRAACSDLARSFSMDELRRVTLEPPSFEPGAQFRYTNANFVLAGILIEEVTGSTVGQVLRSGVLANPSLERLIYQDAEKPTPPVAAPFVVLSAGAAAPEPNDLLRLGGGYLPARCLASSAGPAGGIPYLKALASPLPAVSFCPTGGVDATNAAAYLALDNVVCVGGSWVTPKDAVASGDWPRIEALAREASLLGAKR